MSDRWGDSRRDRIEFDHYLNSGPPEPREYPEEAYQDDDHLDRQECPRCGELDLVAGRCEACDFDADAEGHLLTVDGELVTAGEAIRRLYAPGHRILRAEWSRGYRAEWGRGRARLRHAGLQFGPVAGDPWDSFPPSRWSAAPAPVRAVYDELDRRLAIGLVHGLDAGLAGEIPEGEDGPF